MPIQSSKQHSAAPVAMDTQNDGRSFKEIRQDCLQRQVLFEDPDFPADDSALFYSKSPPLAFEWKRPGVCVCVCVCV